jgi:hypothetical protein
MKILFNSLILLLLFNACCLETNPNNIGDQIAFSIQVKDTNVLKFNNVRIQSIEWLGTNHIDTLNSDTSWNLRLNPHQDQTSFKVNSSNGVDTVTFNYTWETTTFSTYCSSKSGRMQRFYDNLSVFSSRGKISVVKVNRFLSDFQNCVLILN